MCLLALNDINFRSKLKEKRHYNYFLFFFFQLNLKNTSFLLEKLVLRDNLNTLIINLYPGNKGYSLAFRKANELNNQQDSASATSGGSRNNVS